jgi:predicted DNA-binding transcriptional regulator YafY
MPHIKNALLRYRIIDKCIGNKYNPYPTKQDLREACEEALYGSSEGAHICDSTIEKDMFAMKMEHDAPIKYSKKHKGYYYEDPDFTINEIPLTADDMEAINFAAKTLSQFRNVKMFEQFGTAIDKIVDSVNISSDKDAGQYVQFETIPGDSGSEYLPTLLEAIKRKFKVKFDYASYEKGDYKERVVIPLLLKQYRNRWYLISWDINSEGYRTFGLDRIEELEVTKEIVHHPVDFDPDLYFKHSIGITSGEEPQEIILKVEPVAAKYLDSLPLHHSQKVKEMNDDHFIFSLFVSITEELRRELLSFGGDVQVVTPDSLRDTLSRRASKLI